MRLIDADKIPFSQSEDGCLNDVAYRYDINEMPTIEPTSIAPPSNDPLTLDKLREMDGEPVWIERIGSDSPEDKEWALVFVKGGICRTSDCNFLIFELYGKTWLAYRRKPEETV